MFFKPSFYAFYMENMFANAGSYFRIQFKIDKTNRAFLLFFIFEIFLISILVVFIFSEFPQGEILFQTLLVEFFLSGLLIFVSILLLPYRFLLTLLTYLVYVSFRYEANEKYYYESNYNKNQDQRVLFQQSFFFITISILFLYFYLNLFPYLLVCLFLLIIPYYYFRVILSLILLLQQIR